MEKCWFVLKQSQYTPPTLPANGIGTGNGPICPGHIILNTDDLDGVINRTVQGFAFTPAVPIYPTKAWDLEWEMGRGHHVALSADAGVPAAEAVGVTTQANVALAFQRTVQQYRTFDKLERYIILPTRNYVAESLEEAQVAEHIERNKFLGAWTIYMITGVTIARGSRGGASELRLGSANAGAEIGFGGAATGGMNASASAQEGISMSAGAESDFVWAVRLTKIWKGITDRTWSFQTQSKGATFSLEDEDRQKEDEDRQKEDVAQALVAEGRGEAEKLWLGDEDGFIVY